MLLYYILNSIITKVPILGQNQNVSWDNPNTIRGRERTTHQLVQMGLSKNNHDSPKPSSYIYGQIWPLGLSAGGSCLVVRYDFGLEQTVVETLLELN